MSLPTASVVAAALAASLALPLFAQHQFAELGKQHLPPDSVNSWAVASCDVDGDGDPDLVFGNQLHRRDQLYLNDGRGRFTDATASRMPSDDDDTWAVVCCDVDGDGDPDLVFGTDRQSRLYLNDGQGHFTDVTAARMPRDSGAHAAACCDVDGDGDPDLVFGVLNGQNRLYLNDGQGHFTDVTASRMPLNNEATRAVVCCDVDGDGDPDLVFGILYGQNRLYLNDGTGRFTDATASRFPIDFDDTAAVASCDVDGDGDPDLVFGNWFSTAGSQNRLYLNDGRGHFTDATAARMPPDTASALACCDVDGDGDPDLVLGSGWGCGYIGCSGSRNRLYLNDGRGHFTDATASRMPPDIVASAAVACGDLDGDGDPDLVFGNWIGQNKLYLNDGLGHFTDGTGARVPPDLDFTFAVACCDVDGDGDVDLVFGTSGQNRLCLNDGRGHFTDATAARMPIDTGSVAVASCDVDGDGDPDLVFGNGGQNRLYLNDGSGTFTDATAARMPMDTDSALALANTTQAVACCDVDGDGDPDLVFANGSVYGRSPQQNRLYLNDGQGHFIDATVARMPLRLDFTEAVACCDVDGDGDPDLVFGNDSQQNRLYLNDGQGHYTDATASRMPLATDSTQAVRCCDVDGDGDFDVVFGNLEQQNRLYLNDGGGTFTDATATLMPPEDDRTVAVECCDVDGDGDPDLVFGNGDIGRGQQNRLYLNDGQGHFTDATAARMPILVDSTSAVACCDADGDGDPDLVFGNQFGQNRLYLNLLRQLHAPFLLMPGRSYRLDVYARYGPARSADLALPFVSDAPARIPLPPLGTLGLDPAGIVALPAFVIPQQEGVGSVSVAVPGDPSLVGTVIYAQAVLAQYPVQARLTNVTAEQVLR